MVLPLSFHAFATLGKLAVLEAPDVMGEIGGP